MSSLGQIGSAEDGSLPETEMRHILDLMPQLFAVVEADGRISWLNKVALEFLGITLVDLGTDHLRAQVLHPDDLQADAEHRRHAIARGMPFETEQRLRGKDGKYRWFLIRCHPVKDSEGRVARWYSTATDVEDRKRAEEALRRSEAWLTEGQKLSHTGSWVLRPGSKHVIYWSEEMFRIWGFDPNQGPPDFQTTLQRVHPEDREQIVPLFEGAFEGRLTADGAADHRIALPDGTVKYVQQSCRPVFDDDGKVIEYVGTTLDVTERVQADKARREIEEQWTAAFQSNPTMYFIVDVAGAIASVNPFGAEQLGYSVDELVGQPVLNVFYEPDRQDIQRHAAACFEQPGRMLRWEARKIRKDGSMLWVRETANAVTLKKRPVLLVVCEDITEQKHAEEAARRVEKELRDVVDTIPVNVWSAFPDGSIDFVNQRTVETTVLSKEGALGWAWASAVHPDELPGFVDAWRAKIATGSPLEDEVRVAHPDGTYHWSLIRVVPQRDELGRIVKWYGSSIDIEDRKRAEEAARRSEKELSDAIESVPAMLFVALPGPSNVFVSRGWREYTGLSSEETAGFGWQSALHPEDTDHFMEKWRVSFATGEPFEDEARFRRAVDGEYRWFLVRAVAVPDEHGAILKWYGVLTDIEDRRRAEDSLRTATSERAQLAAVREAIGFALARKDSLKAMLQRCVEALVRHLNMALARVWTLSGDGQMLELQASAGMYTRLDGSHSRIPIGHLKIGLIAKEGKPVYTNDVQNDPRISDRDWAKKENIISFTGYPLVVEDRIVGAIGMFSRSELTQGTLNTLAFIADGIAQGIERKRAEDALRRSETYLAEAQKLTRTGSWAFNPLTGKTIYWSDEMFRIFGLDPQEGPSSENFWRLVHPEDADRVRERVEGEAQDKKEYADEYRIVLSDGTVKHILDIGRPVFNDGGDHVEFVGTTVDITERKRAEQALRESEELKRRIIESSTDCIKVLDLDGNLLFMSPGGQQLLEIDNIEPYLSKCWIDFWRPEDRSKVLESLLAAKAGGIGRFHAYCPSAKGAPRWWDVITTPICNANGQPEQLLSVSRDITERKHAEEALRRSEAYLTEAQRLTHIGSWAYDPVTDKLIHFSEELYRIFGVDPQKGTPAIEELWERVHPEDRYRETEINFKKDRGIAEHAIDYRLRFPDGMIKYLHSTRHPVLNDAGEIVEIVGTTIDMTEQKRAEDELHAAEARFRISVDHLTDALFIHDDQDGKGRVIDVNQQACDSLGYTREELIGMTAPDFDPSVDPTFHLSVKERLARGEIFCFETVHRRKDGTEFPVEVRARPFWHGDHRFGLGLARDITDRKRTEAERRKLRELEADIAQMNRVSMMGELAASLAHEIKQPITAAATNAKTSLRWLQRDPPVVEKALQSVSRIVKDVLRAAEIIDRNRSLYTRATPSRGIVNLNELIREMIVLLHEAANRNSVSIRAQFGKGLPETTADRVQIQQVLLNLMLNGIEAMNDTGGELTVTSKRAEDGPVLVSVSDSGIGLPVEDPERIFEAFFTTKAQGTGMGLSISRRIIESHGGRLWASANPGRGATFYFTLPANPEHP